MLIGWYVLERFVWQKTDRESIRLANVVVGARGERRVRDILLRLPDHYSVFWGVQLQKYWDIDFVVVGPRGVFTIEVKSHIGKIGFNGKHLTINGQKLFGKDILWQTMSQSVNLHDYLQRKTSLNIFVTPILVFTSKAVGMRFGLKKIRGVHVIKKDWLMDLVTKQPSAYCANAHLIDNALLELVPITVNMKVGDIQTSSA